MFGLKIEQWLAFTVVAAVISTFGTLVGIVLKDYLFSRAFERWKQRNALEQLYQKFRDPILLSTRELCSRLIEIMDDYPTCYLKKSVIALHPDRQITNDIDDPYFQRYKLVSTVYRLCSFFGWLEFYRQEIVFLYSGNNKHSKQLDDTLYKIRSDLADGQLNTAKDWNEWRDELIFREELRAIGESMLETHGSSKMVIGYGKFCELFDSGFNLSANRWISIVLNFILDLEANGQDFRQIRMARLLVHLVDLLKLLDDSRLYTYFSDARARFLQLSTLHNNVSV